MFNFKDQILLVIAPHPDDEVLGCGGLINKVKRLGGKVYVLFVTVGDTKDISTKGNSSSSERLAEIKAVSKFLKYDGYEIALPGNDFHLKLDSVNQLTLISVIEKCISKWRATILATTNIYDYNQDHSAVGKAVAAATRPMPLMDKHAPNLILGYESVVTAGWAETEIPSLNYYLELSKDDVKLKASALALYKSQVRENSHQRSPEALEKIARVRGMHAGTEYAEGYRILKLISTVKA